jgi:hypothetical protein
MSHDKIRDAARKRMAQTGEPYATARREVIREHLRGSRTRLLVLTWDSMRPARIR